MWVSQSLALELLEEMRTRTFVMSPAVIRGKDKAENSAFFFCIYLQHNCTVSSVFAVKKNFRIIEL